MSACTQAWTFISTLLRFVTTADHLMLCIWVSPLSHPECPERISAVMDMAEKQGLLARCVSVEVRKALYTPVLFQLPISA